MAGTTYRQAMGPVHTWAGVLLAGLLFFVFWTGTLLVFDREIDRWMQPSTRLPATLATTHAGIDGAVLDTVRRIAPGASTWLIRPPSERQPTVTVSWQPPGATESVERHLDPRTGAVLPDTGSEAATGFIFKLHYSLHLDWMRLGAWIVGVAGMGMVVLLVSGIVIHRRLLADFFLFRPRARLQRASLDLHNVTGVLLLPFHLMITLTGLAILINTHWPTVYAGAYDDVADAKKAFFVDAYADFKRPAAGRPAAAQAPVDPMLQAGRRQWDEGVAFVRIRHPGDANGYVEVRRGQQGINMRQDMLWFDAPDGRLLERFAPRPVVEAQRFIVGLHFTQFRHWTLRWLYFASGLAGCVMIAAGLLFWLESRRARHARLGLGGARIVEATSVAAIPGLLIATLAYLLANRLLPPDPAVGSWDRAELEIAAFVAAWLAAFAHAAWRARESGAARASPAWRDQCLAIAALAVATLAAHWASTGDHLARTAGRGDWAVAGVDAMVLLLGAGAAWVARRLGRTSAVAAAAEADDVQPGHA
jgi:uncharacterized iron-regulated membrane protein